jgi:heptaprenyl diphosphate synthase
METMTGAKFEALPQTLRRELRDWLADYISAPHRELGRDGSICPFVEPSVRAHSLVTVGRRWHQGDSAGDMIEIIKESIELFELIPWKARQPNLHALVVVIADMPREDWPKIDEGHRLAKDTVVARNLMLGQFHPECPAPAARNASFRVNRAPWPLIAVRQMAFHDILFLHENPVWFDQYRRRYGHHYTPGAKIDGHFLRLYRSAEEAIGGRRDRPLTTEREEGSR